MREGKVLPLLLIIVNAILVIGLIYYAIPCLTHDTAIVNPTGTLPAEEWEWAGVVLTFGFIPLLVVNVLGFLFVRAK